MVHLEGDMHGSVDASEIGLKPGDFPNRLTVNIPGRGDVHLIRCGGIYTRGGLVGYEYEAPDGFTLTVHNNGPLGVGVSSVG